MNHYAVTSVDGDQYEIHFRNLNIVNIIKHSYAHRRSEEVYYDNLPWPVREAILIAIIKEQDQNATS